MSKRVGIVGAAVTPFKGRWLEKTYYELAQMATREAVKDAQMSIHDVDAAFYGIYNDIFERAAIPEHAIHGLCGMQNKFGIRITTGGATGAYTMSAAHAYLAAGRFKTALVLGVEKSTDCFDFSSMSATPEVIKSIGWSGDSFFEQPIGWSASDSYAEVVLAYMDEPLRGKDQRNLPLLRAARRSCLPTTCGVVLQPESLQQSRGSGYLAIHTINRQKIYEGGARCRRTPGPHSIFQGGGTIAGAKLSDTSQLASGNYGLQSRNFRTFEGKKNERKRGSHLFRLQYPAVPVRFAELLFRIPRRQARRKQLCTLLWPHGGKSLHNRAGFNRWEFLGLCLLPSGQP